MKSHWLKLVFIIILFMALIKYLSLHTTFWDLGWQDYIVYNIIKGQRWEFLFRGHAHIFSVFYGFLYKIFPSPILLLTSQILAMVGAGVLVSSLGTVKGEKKTPVHRLPTILLILYVLYFPVWYNCLFDFHYEHLFVLFCALFYWLVVKTTDYRLLTKIMVFLICMLCCLVKEVFALSAIMMGVYVIVRKRWFFCGSLVVVFGLAYFVFVECYAIPYFTAGKEAPAIWSSAFGYLGRNMKAVFLHLLTHPWLFITEIFSDWRKLLYIIAIFGPFFFIPLLAPLELLPALPQLFISLLSHNPNHYALSSQYTAGLIVPVFVAFIYGVKKLEDWKVLTLRRVNIFVVLSGLFFHILLSPSPISRIFWFELVPQYHYTVYIPRKRDGMVKMAIKKYIPGDFSVSVSTQNSVNCAHLAHRRYYFCFPTGVIEPARVPGGNRGLAGWSPVGSGQRTKGYRLIYADYVVLDLKRQWFINDRGCNRWQNGKCHNPSFSQEFLKIVEEVRKRYDLVYENDGLIILKR